MRPSVVAIVASACAAPIAVSEPAPFACTDYDYGADPDVVCRPPPTVAGEEFVDCDSQDNLRCCRFRDGACVMTLCRRDEDCTTPWFELATNCRIPTPVRME